MVENISKELVGNIPRSHGKIWVLMMEAMGIPDRPRCERRSTEEGSHGAPSIRKSGRAEEFSGLGITGQSA
jgi:hypothetical protein